MRYRVRLDFVCHDYKMIGDVERELEDIEVFRPAVTFFDVLKPAILEKYPAIADAVDAIDIDKIVIERI